MAPGGGSRPVFIGRDYIRCRSRRRGCLAEETTQILPASLARRQEGAVRGLQKNASWRGRSSGLQKFMMIWGGEALLKVGADFPRRRLLPGAKTRRRFTCFSGPIMNLQQSLTHGIALHLDGLPVGLFVKAHDARKTFLHRDGKPACRRAAWSGRPLSYGFRQR